MVLREGNSKRSKVVKMVSIGVKTVNLTTFNRRFWHPFATFNRFVTKTPKSDSFGTQSGKPTVLKGPGTPLFRVKTLFLRSKQGQ